MRKADGEFPLYYFAILLIVDAIEKVSCIFMALTVLFLNIKLRYYLHSD